LIIRKLIKQFIKLVIAFSGVSLQLVLPRLTCPTTRIYITNETIIF